MWRSATNNLWANKDIDLLIYQKTYGCEYWPYALALCPGFVAWMVFFGFLQKAWNVFFANPFNFLEIARSKSPRLGSDLSTVLACFSSIRWMYVSSLSLVGGWRDVRLEILSELWSPIVMSLRRLSVMREYAFPWTGKGYAKYLIAVVVAVVVVVVVVGTVSCEKMCLWQDTYIVWLCSRWTLMLDVNRERQCAMTTFPIFVLRTFGCCIGLWWSIRVSEPAVPCFIDHFITGVEMVLSRRATHNSDRAYYI